MLALALSVAFADPKPCTVRWFYDPWQHYRGPRVVVKEGAGRIGLVGKVATYDTARGEAASIDGSIRGTWRTADAVTVTVGREAFVSRPFTKRDWWVIFDEHAEDGTLRFEFDRTRCTRTDIVTGIVGLWSRIPSETMGR